MSKKVPISIRVVPFSAEDKKGPKAYRFSNFNITMNTNRRFDEGAGEMTDHAATLSHAAETVCDNIDRHLFFRGLAHPVRDGEAPVFAEPAEGEPYSRDPDLTWNVDNIPGVKVVVRSEIGHNARGKRLHVHVALKIKHVSYMWLDKDSFLDSMNVTLGQLGFDFPIKYIHVQARPMSPEDYLDWD